MLGDCEVIGLYTHNNLVKNEENHLRGEGSDREEHKEEAEHNEGDGKAPERRGRGGVADMKQGRGERIGERG